MKLLLCLGVSGCVATGGTADTDPDASAAADTADSGAGDSAADTAECVLPETVVVALWAYDAEGACWARTELTLDADYWWMYAPPESCEAECADLAWVFPATDTCVLVPSLCSELDSWNDPAFSRTAEQEAICAAIPVDTPECPEG